MTLFKTEISIEKRIDAFSVLRDLFRYLKSSNLINLLYYEKGESQMKPDKIYENENYLIENDLDFSYIINKKNLNIEKIRLEDKFLMDFYAKIIKSGDNHIWYDDNIKEVILEEVETYHEN